MSNIQIEYRIQRLEKQLKNSRFLTFGLLAFMVSTYLIGNVSAKNEVLNVDRIVASEYVLSKDGKEYGKWHVKPERELTKEEKKFSTDLGLLEAPKSYPPHASMLIGEEKAGGELLEGIRMTNESLEITYGNQMTLISALFGIIITDNDNEGGTFIDSNSIDVGATLIGSNSISINSTEKEASITIGSGESIITKGIRLQANSEEAHITTGQLNEENSMVSIYSNYSSGSIGILGSTKGELMSILPNWLFFMNPERGMSAEIKTQNGEDYVRVGSSYKSHAKLSSNSESSSMTITDAKGANRAVIGNVDLVTKKTGDTTKKSASSITLFDQESNVIYSLPK